MREFNKDVWIDNTQLTITMGGGGDPPPPQPEKTTTTTEPWAQQKPFLEYGFDEAKRLYQSDDPRYYEGQTLADQSNITKSAQQMQLERGLQGSPVMDAAQMGNQATSEGAFLGNDFASRGFQGATAGAFDNYVANSYGRQLADGNLPGNAYLQSTTYGSRQTPAQEYLTGELLNNRNVNPADQYLQNMAQGQNATLQATAEGNMLNANPYLDQMYGRMADRITENYQTAIAPEIASSAVAAGRYGSGYHQRAREQAADNLGETLSNAANDVYAQNYATERGRQLQAAQQLAQNQLAATGQIQGAADTDVVQKLQATGQLQGAYESDINQRLGAADSMNANRVAGIQSYADMINANMNRRMAGLEGYGDMFNAERQRMMQASQLAPSLAAADYQDIAAIADVGAQQEARAQAEINQDIARHNFNTQREANKLAQYMNLVQGQYGGTSTTVAPVYRGGTSSGASAIGGAMAGAGTGFMIGGPWGAAAGAGVGLLGGMM